MGDDSTIRFAVEGDADSLVALMRGLAGFEASTAGGYVGVVTISPEEMAALFRDGIVEALVAEDRCGSLVGCATFYTVWSTWSGKSCIYLEDLFVTETGRGHGTGRSLMKRLAEICIERDCERIDWICSVPNAAGLSFYEALGAQRMDDAVHHRLSGAALNTLAGSSSTPRGEED